MVELKSVEPIRKYALRSVQNLRHGGGHVVAPKPDKNSADVVKDALEALQ